MVVSGFYFGKDIAMKKEYIMGNSAIALGALAAGVNVVSGYPGTPSSAIVETVYKYPPEGVYLE